MIDCKCKGCGKRPDEIDEYVQEAKDKDITPFQYVRENEGTYNMKTKRFYCTNCYIKIGMPLGTA